MSSALSSPVRHRRIAELLEELVAPPPPSGRASSTILRKNEAGGRTTIRRVAVAAAVSDKLRKIPRCVGFELCERFSLVEVE